MSALYWIGALVSFAVFIYLVAALFVPEWFE